MGHLQSRPETLVNSYQHILRDNQEERRMQQSLSLFPAPLCSKALRMTVMFR
jgi:hypothetical protein